MPFVHAKEITIPGRTCEVFPIKINNNLETGYVPRLEFGKGIYAGEALVTNKQGKGYIRIFKTQETDAVLETPSVDLEEFEMRSQTLISPHGR